MITEGKFVAHKEEEETVVVKLPSLEVTCRNVKAKLSLREFRVLSFLTTFSGTPFTREEILAECFPREVTSVRSVDACIHNIRKKLFVDFIITVYGNGYLSPFKLVIEQSHLTLKKPKSVEQEKNAIPDMETH